mgnify:FL=1
MFNDEISKVEQKIAKLERHYALEKIKERKKETRHKIQLGGLVIKSGMDKFSKNIILGALIDALENLERDADYQKLCEHKGEASFNQFEEN